MPLYDIERVALQNNAGGRFFTSEKMILIDDPVSNEKSHRVIRLIDPYNGTEKVYDLTEAAEKIGKKTSGPAKKFFYTWWKKGAVIFTKPDGFSFTKVLMCDLESGRIYVK